MLAVTGGYRLRLDAAFFGPCRDAGSPGMILGLGTATNPDPGLAGVAEFRLALA